MTAANGKSRSTLANYRDPIILITFCVLGAILGLQLGPRAAFLKPIGQIFLNLLFCLIVPLIFFSIAGSIANTKDTGKVGKMIGYTLIIFIITAVISGCLILLVTHFTGVPTSFSVPTAAANTAAGKPVTIADQIVNTLTVGDLPLLISRFHVLPLIILTIFFGICVSRIGEPAKPIVEWMNAMSLVCYKMVAVLMKAAPIGLGAYFADLTGTYGVDLLEEPELNHAALPDSLELDLPIDGDRILGEIYLPAGVYDGPHPTVILCHGIPGTNNNDDVAQCLRRMGCVVIRPYHRGAWGSEGIYSFSHCIGDAVALAHWAREEVARAYDIDTKNIFLAGHSNGGNTVLNAARRLPFLRGVIAFCPYDHQAGLEHIPHQDLKSCFQEAAAVLRVGRFEDLWQDSVQHASQWSFAANAHRFQDRNLLLIGGRRDTVAPPCWMIEPLWRELEALPTRSHHKKVLLDTNHGLDNARLALIRTIGEWVQEVVED